MSKGRDVWTRAQTTHSDARLVNHDEEMLIVRLKASLRTLELLRVRTNDAVEGEVISIVQRVHHPLLLRPAHLRAKRRRRALWRRRRATRA